MRQRRSRGSTFWPAHSADKPLKVYILAGQSNMEGKAKWLTVGNDRPYHYLGSGKWYFLKGVAFGQAMLELEK